MRTQQDDSHLWTRKPSPDTKYASALVLDLLATRAVKNKLLLFISHPVYSAIISWMDWTTSTVHSWTMQAGSEGVHLYWIFSAVNTTTLHRGQCLVESPDVRETQMQRTPKLSQWSTAVNKFCTVTYLKLTLEEHGLNYVGPPTHQFFSLKIHYTTQYTAGWVLRCRTSNMEGQLWSQRRISDCGRALATLWFVKGQL